MLLLDYGDKRPIYEQVVERMQNLILSGGIEAESQLSSVRQMALDLAVNPNTIQRAYGELERTGYIYSVKGRGNFVRDEESLQKLRREKLHGVLKAALEDCRRAGMTKEELLEEFTKIMEETR